MNRSRWTVLVLVAAALGLSLAYGLKGSGHPAPQSPKVTALQAAAALDPCPTGLGAALPKATLPCLGGGPAVDLRARGSGLPTLVNVYGSWCGPCLKEMPILRQFRDQARGKVAVVGIDTSDDFDKGLQFAKDVGQHWPAIYDNDRLVGARFFAGVPGTLFLDPSGKLVHVDPAAFSSLAQLKALVSQHLGVSL